MKSYRFIIRSKNPSAQLLRDQLRNTRLRTPVIVRIGSTTRTNQIKTDITPIEINTVDGVVNSSDKKKMKELFDMAGVRTAEWVWGEEDASHLGFPLIIKHRHSHGGNGLFFIQTQEELDEFINTQEELDRFIHSNIHLRNYIIEKYYNYGREYRLHVFEDRCIYTCRKLIKNDTPDDQRWHRHDCNCVWYIESNPLFNKPETWDEIVAECVKAKDAVGLDIAAIDVKVSTNGRDFIILETNSGPSLGEGTAERYANTLLNHFESIII